MTRTASNNSPPEPAEYKSLGLNALFGLLRADRKYSILDMGQALGGNIDFWSQFSCRLHIEDFYRYYATLKPPTPEEPERPLFEGLLAYAPDTVFDIILAWDLFDYLNPEELEALIKRLCTWCRSGTLVFALVSSLPRIPAEPIVFRILDSERMIYDVRTQETRPCPRHQPRDVARLMARFNVSQSFLLRHGVQEYVFIYK